MEIFKQGMNTFSTHNTGMKGSHERFHKNSHAFFNHGMNGHVKTILWFIYQCVCCGFNNHCMKNYWNIQSLQERISRKEEQGKSCFPKMENEWK